VQSLAGCRNSTLSWQVSTLIMADFHMAHPIPLCLMCRKACPNMFTVTEQEIYIITVKAIDAHRPARNMATVPVLLLCDSTANAVKIKEKKPEF